MCNCIILTKLLNAENADKTNKMAIFHSVIDTNKRTNWYSCQHVHGGQMVFHSAGGYIE